MFEQKLPNDIWKAFSLGDAEGGLLGWPDMRSWSVRVRVSISLVELKDGCGFCFKVHKSFGSKVALRVSFRLPKYGVVGLLGPNGAGKSTMIGCWQGCFGPILGRCSLEVPPSRVESARTLGGSPNTIHFLFIGRFEDWVVEASQSRGGTKKQAFDAWTGAISRCMPIVPLGFSAKAGDNWWALRRHWHQP